MVLRVYIQCDFPHERKTFWVVLKRKMPGINPPVPPEEHGTRAVHRPAHCVFAQRTAVQGWRRQNNRMGINQSVQSFYGFIKESADIRVCLW
jgi:hypothetical protein